MIKFSEEHVWLRVSDPKQPHLATLGITDHAQETLGDIVFVELPEMGKILSARSVAAVVESVKAAADVFMPATGTVIEVNESLRQDPSLANSQALGAGWFAKVSLAELSELDLLMDEATYTEFLKSV